MSTSSKPSGQVSEIRYPLPELLEELKAERAIGSFGSERLEQTEIGKLFKVKAPRRVKPKK